MSPSCAASWSVDRSHHGSEKVYRYPKQAEDCPACVEILLSLYRLQATGLSGSMGRLAVVVSLSSVLLVAAWVFVGSGGSVTTNATTNNAATNFPGYTPRKNSRSTAAEAPDNEGRQPGEEDRRLPSKVTRPQPDRHSPRTKKKKTMKGVQVDRNNVIEDVTMQDLEAPEGRLWIPAAIVGPVRPSDANPLHHVLVAYCQLDMKAYHETPWKFAMGTFHQRQSGCLSDKSLVRTYRLSSLAVSAVVAGRSTFWSRVVPPCRMFVSMFVSHFIADSGAATRTRCTCPDSM